MLEQGKELFAPLGSGKGKELMLQLRMWISF